MIKAAHLFLILFIVGATTTNIRLLTDKEDNCEKEGYLDKDGKIS